MFVAGDVILFEKCKLLKATGKTCWRYIYQKNVYTEATFSQSAGNHNNKGDAVNVPV